MNGDPGLQSFRLLQHRRGVAACHRRVGRPVSKHYHQSARVWRASERRTVGGPSNSHNAEAIELLGDISILPNVRFASKD